MRSAMQRWWLGIFVAAVLIAVLVKSKAPPAPSEDALVLEVDQALGAAMRADDKSIARKLLSLQFTFVDANGKNRERKDFLADLKTAAAAPPSDPVVKLYGRIGMVTGHRKSADGRDVFFLDIWAKQKRAWRALVSPEVVLAATDTPRPAPARPGAATAPYDCRKSLSDGALQSALACRAGHRQFIPVDREGRHRSRCRRMGEAHRRRVRALRQRPRADCQSGRIATINRQKENDTAGDGR